MGDRFLHIPLGTSLGLFRNRVKTFLSSLSFFHMEVEAEVDSVAFVPGNLTFSVGTGFFADTAVRRESVEARDFQLWCFLASQKRLMQAEDSKRWYYVKHYIG
jgi:hypothetical protein